MRDVELLVFDGYDDLAGRLLPGASDGLPRGRVLVHHARDPKGRVALLVEAAGGALGSPAGVKKLKGRIDTATNRVLTHRTILEKVLYAIERSEMVDTLLHAVKPLRSAVAPDLDRDGHVLAWCQDAARFSLLVQECLSFGCDRIRWSALDAGGRGAAAILARVDAPPWYLMERWNRPESGLAPLYAPAADRVYVRWGYSHPLAARLSAKPDELLLADGDGVLHRVPDGGWRDLYDAIAVTAEGLSSVRWAPADPAPRFTVALKLAEAAERVEPELWLLWREDLPAVERLLGLMPESDLKHLAIAFFQDAATGGAAEGRPPVAAMREVITGRGRGWMSFGRAGFRALTGLPNLFLPVDRALDPPLRRDRIAEAFELRGGELVVVQPAAQHGSMRAVRIPESSFRPLATYVDYVVTGDSARLQALVSATVFDPGPLAQLAEAAPDPQERASVKEPKPGAPAAAGGRPRPEPIAPRPVEPEGGAKPEPEVEPDPLERSVSAEQLVEARIALDPPGQPADWQELGELRRLRSDVDGAVECWENARWTDRARDAEARRRAISALEAALQIPDTAEPAERPALALARQDGAGDVRTLRLRALYLEEGTIPHVTHRPEYLGALDAEARAALAAGRLRKKTRWLVWSAILSRTGDDIEAERQREAILADLNQSGLSPMDRADFVRVRLAERAIDGGDTGELRRTMEGLTVRLGRIEDARVKWSGIALLARRWAELDDVPRARKLATEAIAAMSDGRTAGTARVHANAAVALLRTRDPQGDVPFRRALDIIGAIANAEDRSSTLLAALESLSTVGDPRAVAPLVDASLAVLEKEDARRAALTIARCAPVLKKLEATTRARAFALRLAQDPKVHQDAHYLSGAVGGLAQLQGNRPLAPNVLAPILDAVRRHRRDLEEVNVRLVEGAVALAGEDFAHELSDGMRRLSPGEVTFAQLLTWAAALQGLAAAHAAESGLQDLDRALKVAWELSNDDERRRGVKRLTSIIPLFGRVTDGLALVQDVVRRSAAPGIGPYFRSEVLSACVDVAARLGARRGAFEVMGQVIQLVETTARGSPGDVSFLFDVLGLCVDHAVTIGASGESAAIINRVVALVEESGDETSPRYWTPFYRYRALAKCARGYARLGHEAIGMPLLGRILDRTPQTTGLDRFDLLDEIVLCLSEVGGEQRLALVDRVLDAFLTERAVGLNERGARLLGLLLDEVVSPASRVRAEYARYLGAEERSIRDRVANDTIASS